MLESEVAETLMSLSAPDERQFASPLHAADGLPWHVLSSSHNDKKRSFLSFHNNNSNSSMTSSLPSGGAAYLRDYASLQRTIRDSPLTSMIPAKHRRRDVDLDDEDDEDDDEDDTDTMDTMDHDDTSSDVDMSMDDASSSSSPKTAHASAPWRSFRSPFDGLVAAAASNQHDDCSSDSYDAYDGASRPISIPSKQRSLSGLGGFALSPQLSPDRSHHSHGHSHSHHGLPIPTRRSDSHKNQKWSLSRVKEDASYIGQDCSPTGVEDDRAWFETYRQTDEYRQRARLASVCSSDGSISEYGGFGRKHLEEFIRMEISATNENEPSNQSQLLELDEGSPPARDGDLKYIGSYSPDARRQRIERFLEKRKHRVWSKKVDYDVRKNFANSRLRVKGRFVKKEDEELLCQLMSFT